MLSSFPVKIKSHLQSSGLTLNTELYRWRTRLPVSLPCLVATVDWLRQWLLSNSAPACLSKHWCLTSDPLHKTSDLSHEPDFGSDSLLMQSPLHLGDVFLITMNLKIFVIMNLKRWQVLFSKQKTQKCWITHACRRLNAKHPGPTAESHILLPSNLLK
jgi:hypothetical protein